MRKSEALEHFGNSPSALARALGIRPESIYSWGEIVPGLRQLQLERLTKGALKADSKFKSPSEDRAA
jgi:transcriptional repressor of cell division inhibition gene dicB